jgi:hypothetical protein
LQQIKTFFGVGNINLNAGNKAIRYSVKSLKDITNVIIPFFEKYPLLTKKQADFELFKKVVALMNFKEHLNDEGILKIVAIRSSMNLGLNDVLKLEFPDVIPVQRALVQFPESIDLN